MKTITTIYINREFDEDIEVQVECEITYETGEGWYSVYQKHYCKESPNIELTQKEIDCAQDQAFNEYYEQLTEMRMDDY